MTLRRHTFWITSMTLACLLVVVGAISRGLLIRDFAHLESDLLRVDVRRATNGIRDSIAYLDTQTNDWAAWSDTYRFVQHPNAAYVRSNLGDATYAQLRLNVLLVVDTAGRVVAGSGYDPAKGRRRPIPEGLSAHLTATNPLVHHTSLNSAVHGVIILPGGPMLIASRPIITSERRGPIRGALLMGRFLDKMEIARVARVAQVNMSVVRWDDERAAPDFRIARSVLHHPPSVYLRPLSRTTTAGYALLLDVYGKPALIVQATMGRQVVQQGQTTIRYLLVCLAVSGVVFCAVILVCLEAVVLFRLTRLNVQVQDVTTKGDPAMRICMGGTDEIYSLAKAINAMLAAIYRGEIALRESESRFRTILQSVQAGILIVDPEDHRIVDVNPAGALFLGRPREQIVGERCQHFICPTEEGLCPAIDLKRSVINTEGAYLTADGEVRPVLKTVTPVVLGGRALLLESFVDLSERKQMEDALQRAKDAAEEATRLKSQFLAHVSHEIRTPMNGVIGMVAILLASELTPEQRECAETARDSAEALLQVINDILDLSKIEADRLFLDPAPFRLREEIGKALKALAVQAHAKDLELCCRIDPGVPDAVIGDIIRLRQVINNLVGNAIKFTEAGEVALEVRAADEPRAEGADSPDDDRQMATLRISVRDTGIGIPPEKQRVIFEPFTQADASTTRQYGGTGLGLTICRRLVQMMGGRIWVTGEEGSGSTFHFTVQLGVAEEADSGPDDQARLAGLRVLVADDNDTSRGIVCELLAGRGMMPVGVRTGLDALSAFEDASNEDAPFSLAILDSQMPAMDGTTVAQFLAAQPGPTVPSVLLFTTAERYLASAGATDAGVAAMVAKPIMPGDLWSAIAVALGMRGAAAPAAATGATLPGAHSLRILLAEDNPVNQKLAVHLLQARGHTVTVADDGGKALAALDSGGFDLLLLDVQMPVMDGLQVAATIRRRERQTGERLPIIAMTAHASRSDRDRCLAAGMDDHLTKPVRADDLYAVVDHLVGVSRAAVDGAPNVPSVSRVQEGHGRDGAAPAPAAGGEAPPVDLGVAMAVVGGHRGVLNRMAATMAQESPKKTARLEDAVRAGDADGVMRTAHALRGALASLGATRAVGLAGELEQRGRDGQIGAMLPVVARLRAEIGQVIAFYSQDDGEGHS